MGDNQQMYFACILMMWSTLG